MGRGNFFPALEPYKMWYIDNDAIFGGDSEEQDEMAYEFFKDELGFMFKQALPSMVFVSKWAEYTRDEYVFMRNGFAQIVLSDNEWSIAISITALPDNESKSGLTQKWIAQVSSKIEAELLRRWPGAIHTRTGPWTSEQLTDKWVMNKNKSVTEPATK